jgi:hypothetical protein
MAIKHILKDGTVLDDISGHIVKMEDAELAYQIMDQLNEERGRKHDGRIDDERMA